MSAPSVDPSTFEPHWVQKGGREIGVVYRPRTIEEALALRVEHPDARPIAGGTDLLLDLARSENGPPIDAIDLTAIGGFADIEFDEVARVVNLGGGVRHNDVLRNKRMSQIALPLAQACFEVGSPQLRNRATIAGNLVTASPANDTISALMALGATIQLSRHDNGDIAHRSVPVSEFFDGFRSTVLGADELVTKITVPMLERPDRGVWVKAGLRKAQAISVVHLGIAVGFDEDDTVQWARIALGSVAPTVVLAEDVASSMVGRRLDASAIAEVAEMTAASITPIDDLRAPAAYRHDVVAVMMRRALSALAEDRQAEVWPQTVATLASTSPPGESALIRTEIDDESEIVVQLNGVAATGAGAASATLLDWLRVVAGTGTKEGCAEGECGACTVHLDDAAVMSCLVPAAQADGTKVTTIEGVADATALHPMQQAFVDHFAVQCGYCIPGFIMSATSLLNEFTEAGGDPPSRAEIEHALAGNLCRCTGYYPILAAIETALNSGASS